MPCDAALSAQFSLPRLLRTSMETFRARTICGSTCKKRASSLEPLLLLPDPSVKQWNLQRRKEAVIVEHMMRRFGERLLCKWLKIKEVLSTAKRHRRRSGSALVSGKSYGTRYRLVGR